MPYGSPRRSTHKHRYSGASQLHERRMRNRIEKATVGNAQIILKKLHIEHSERTRDFKEHTKQWDADRADLDAQEAEQRRKKKALEEAQAEWVAAQETLKQYKLQTKMKKKELTDVEMELNQEQMVLLEKEQEVAEFQKTHHVMIKRLEQSIGRNSSMQMQE